MAQTAGYGGLKHTIALRVDLEDFSGEERVNMLADLLRNLLFTDYGATAEQHEAVLRMLEETLVAKGRLRT